jgi:hypothetical protein
MLADILPAKAAVRGLRGTRTGGDVPALGVDGVPNEPLPGRGAPRDRPAERPGR